MFSVNHQMNYSIKCFRSAHLIHDQILKQTHTLRTHTLVLLHPHFTPGHYRCRRNVYNWWNHQNKSFKSREIKWNQVHRQASDAKPKPHFLCLIHREQPVPSTKCSYMHLRRVRIKQNLPTVESHRLRSRCNPFLNECVWLGSDRGCVDITLSFCGREHKGEGLHISLKCWRNERKDWRREGKEEGGTMRCKLHPAFLNNHNSFKHIQYMKYRASCSTL